MIFPRRMIVVLCFGLLLITGCFGGVPEFSETMVAVTGTVKINEEPAEGIALIFHPETGTPGTGAYAVSDSQGQFTVMHRSQKEGIEKGNYKVTFSKFTLQDGSPIPEGKDLADVNGKQTIPLKYNDVEKTSLEATVTDQPKSLEFNLIIKTNSRLK